MTFEEKVNKYIEENLLPEWEPVVGHEEFLLRSCAERYSLDSVCFPVGCSATCKPLIFKSNGLHPSVLFIQKSM